MCLVIPIHVKELNAWSSVTWTYIDSKVVLHSVVIGIYTSDRQAIGGSGALAKARINLQATEGITSCSWLHQGGIGCVEEKALN
jgi:hypothetical protein